MSQPRTYQTHVTGLGFPEGPVVLKDGAIAFVDLLHAKIRVFRDGKVSELCTVQGSPNGMRMGPDGMLYVTNNGGLAPAGGNELRFGDPSFTGRIQRVDPATGAVEDLATELPGAKPWRPNDLVFSPEGDIVFTDPQNWEVLRDPEKRHTYHGGQLLAAGLDGKVRLLAEMTGFPNGLTFHPDGFLLVGITRESRIVRFDWKDGAVGPGETWMKFDDKFAPDGMAFHGDRLYVTGSVGDRIAVLSREGEMLEMIDCGEGSDPTNLCIAGDTLWVTFGMPGTLVSYSI